jgi:hypothetical protein
LIKQLAPNQRLDDAAHFLDVEAGEPRLDMGAHDAARRYL